MTAEVWKGKQIKINISVKEIISGEGLDIKKKKRKRKKTGNRRRLTKIDQTDTDRQIIMFSRVTR